MTRILTVLYNVANAREIEQHSHCIAPCFWASEYRQCPSLLAPQSFKMAVLLHLQTILHGAETISNRRQYFFKLSVDPSYQGAHPVVTNISAALLSPTAIA